LKSSDEFGPLAKAHLEIDLDTISVKVEKFLDFSTPNHKKETAFWAFAQKIPLFYR
jgi:hypothetical protein